ncbi:MAG: aldehyde dehydrogenase family protein [Acidimicrobiia bacterium]|nr:aldehyde dehydrogenase family protein [Acidimicrobiia bacterium]
MLIDGKLVDAVDGRTFDNVNPATEEVLGPVADGNAADMEAAVGAARRAFDSTTWATDHAFRAQCLRQLQTALESEREELRSELVAEVGCPVLATYGPQLDSPLAEALLWPAETLETFPWSRALPPKDPFGLGMTEREVWKEPVGVVGVIVPWNFPIEITLNKLGPVLAMGNTCVIKPAPDTPFNATRLGRLVAEHTDIPPGVVNVVTSQDHLTGEVLTTSPEVDMVAFTGSTVTGRRIMEAGSATMKRVFLECGGKSVNLVLDDVDIAAAAASAGAMCFHAGQGCAITTRMLVPNSHYDEAVESARAAFEGVTYGDPTDASNLMGPLVSEKQRQRVLGYINSGKEQGATLVVGGGIPSHLDKGYFVEPTLFANVDNSMKIAQEEIFGPVLVLIGYQDEDDAVAIANDSVYGLSGMITSKDLDRAKRVARRIRTGTLSLNGGVWYGADAPFGGYKQSGLGRQCGIEGLEIFTETKTVGWPVQA